MNKNVGRVRRNEGEEIRLSLQEADGELHVELRVYSRSRGQGAAQLPEPEAIVIPARVLSELSRALEAAHNSLHNEGVVERRPCPISLQSTAAARAWILPTRSTRPLTHPTRFLTPNPNIAWPSNFLLSAICYAPQRIRSRNSCPDRWLGVCGS